ncbi:MAG: hypothetical protein MUF84_04195 [Anaerolineae bacterium]|nr:hypothetical protein [Anaerolineae bacterium]
MSDVRVRRLLTCLLFLAVLAGCGTPTGTLPAATPVAEPTIPAPPTSSPTTPTPTPRPPAPTPSFEESVDIGGSSLYIRCHGEGSPTVICDAGLDRNRKGWMVVQRRIAYATRVCVYDRAGLGQSDPRPTLPCTTQDQADDLHALSARPRSPAPTSWRCIR